MKSRFDDIIPELSTYSNIAIPCMEIQSFSGEQRSRSTVSAHKVEYDERRLLYRQMLSDVSGR